MKRVYLIAIAISFALFVQAQSKAGGPKIQFLNDSYDFGLIDGNKTFNAEFKFCNTGDAPLLLINVKPTCGCTASNWPRHPIMPGDTATITAAFNSRGYEGKPFHKSINVITNVKENGRDKVFIIYIKGKVKQ
jgi:hypothetical protein